MLSLTEAYALIPDGAVAVRRPRGLIRLTGPQRVWFLQNTISNDVEQAREGTWVESCFLDPKGKVLAHFRVGVAAEELWVDVDEPGTEPLLDWFVRYRFRTKVEIENRTADSITVIGAGARDVAAHGAFEGRAFGDTLGDLPVAIVPASDLPEAPSELYEVLRIESGTGEFGVDYGPDTLPQEAGLTNIVSVTKGCYVGQEVMARLHFRGHVNKVLRRIELAEPSEPGRALTYRSEPVGRITSTAVSPRLGPLGIAMVRVAVPEGDSLDVEGGGSARVGPIPAGTKTV